MTNIMEVREFFLKWIITFYGDISNGSTLLYVLNDSLKYKQGGVLNDEHRGQLYNHYRKRITEGYLYCI